jgi:hypothetical protein
MGCKREIAVPYATVAKYQSDVKRVVYNSLSDATKSNVWQALLTAAFAVILDASLYDAQGELEAYDLLYLKRI